MTRNAASKCNNKYLSASKSCVQKNYADLTCIHHMKYRARNRIEKFYVKGQGGIVCSYVEV